MNHRTLLLTSLINTCLFATGVAFAQQPHTPHPNTAQGLAAVHSTMDSKPVVASPPPSFQQLAHGKKVITKEAAAAYPPLANEFDYASRGHKTITKAQYERWLKNLD